MLSEQKKQAIRGLFTKMEELNRMIANCENEGLIVTCDYKMSVAPVPHNRVVLDPYTPVDEADIKKKPGEE